jgi:hypothetical protein
VQPIKETQQGQDRQIRVAAYLMSIYPWYLCPTPRFYFTDYHINKLQGLGRENYIGDLEIKWADKPSSEPYPIPYTKIQQMLALPLHRDLPDSYHRILIRYTDGLLMLNVEMLRDLRPVLYTFPGVDEIKKLYVFVNASDFFPYFKPIIIR